MSEVKQLKKDESTTVRTPFVAYTCVECPKHKKQMIATLKVPVKSKVKRISDSVYTTTDSYVKSVSHSGATCSLGKSLTDNQKFVPRSSVRFFGGLRIMLDQQLAQRSTWGANHIDVWKPAPSKKAEPKKVETKKVTPKKVETKKVTPKKAPSKKATTQKPEPKKAPSKKATTQKPEPKKPEPKKAPSKKAEPKKAPSKKATTQKPEPKKAPSKKAEPKKVSTVKKEMPKKKIEDADENIMEKFFSNSTRKNNIS